MLDTCRLVMISMLVVDWCCGEDAGFHVSMNDAVQVRIVVVSYKSRSTTSVTYKHVAADKQCAETNE